MKAETVRGYEGGSEMNLQLVGWAIVDVLVTGLLILRGGVIGSGPLTSRWLGWLLGLWRMLWRH